MTAVMDEMQESPETPVVVPGSPVEPPPDTEPAPAPAPDTEPAPEPEPEAEGRCQAVATLSSGTYRCALEAGHDGEHSFQRVSEEEEEEESPAGWAPKSEREVAKATDQLEREAERHAKRVQQILGADAEGLVQCVLCSPSLAGWRADTAPTPETVAAVRVAIGLPDVSNFRPSHTEARCDNCAGLGKVNTGSLVPNHETAKCDACGGKGYTQTRPRVNAEPSAEATEPHTNGEAPAVDDGVQRDMFGTPITDEDYGKMPAMRKRPITYWQQTNNTAQP